MKPKDQVRIISSVRIRAHGVIEDAVTMGVVRGWHLIHESDDERDETTAIETLSAAVMTALAGLLEFETERDD